MDRELWQTHPATQVAELNAGSERRGGGGLLPNKASERSGCETRLREVLGGNPEGENRTHDRCSLVLSANIAERISEQRKWCGESEYCPGATFAKGRQQWF